MPSHKQEQYTMPPRRRARQQLLRQQEGQIPEAPPVRPPPTKQEIALSYQQKEIRRRENSNFLLKGIFWILVVGGLLTWAARHFSHERLRHEREHYRVVVSIAPAQLDSSLQPLLESLVEKQEFPPKMVYIITPPSSSSSSANDMLPEFVREYVNDKTVLIISASTDFGPLNKYYYGVEMESFDTRIIAMPDDSYKPVETTFISNMIKQSLKYPDAVVGFEGAHLQNNKNAMMFETFNASRNSVVDMIKGPMMVQRRFFDVDGFKELVQSLADGDHTLADNAVVAAHFEQQGIERRIVKRFARMAARSVMPREYLDAVKYFQEHLGIWKKAKFQGSS